MTPQELGAIIAEEVAKARAEFAVSDDKRVADLGDIARIVSRQPRRGEVDNAVCRAIAREAKADLARRAGRVAQ